MPSVTSQLIEEVAAYAQSDSLKDAREICVDGTYFPNNLRIFITVQNFDLRNSIKFSKFTSLFISNLSLYSYP